MSGCAYIDMILEIRNTNCIHETLVREILGSLWICGEFREHILITKYFSEAHCTSVIWTSCFVISSVFYFLETLFEGWGVFDLKTLFVGGDGVVPSVGTVERGAFAGITF